MENQQSASNQVNIANDSQSNIGNQNIDSSNQITNNFDVSRYFSEDLRKDPDFERLSKNIPNDPVAIVKDLYHKTKHFGKVRESVRAELEAEINKPAIYQENDYQYQLPENYFLEDELLGSAKAKAVELGIKPEQFKSFMESMFESDAKIKALEMQQIQKAEEEAIQSLKNEWGADYEKKKNKVETMLQYFTSPEDDVKIQNLPGEAKILLAKLMDKVSQKIQEPSVGKLTALTTRDTAQNEYNRIISDKSHPYHRGDPNALKQVFELQKILTR